MFLFRQNAQGHNEANSSGIKCSPPIIIALGNGLLLVILATFGWHYISGTQPLPVEQPPDIQERTTVNVNSSFHPSLNIVKVYPRISIAIIAASILLITAVIVTLVYFFGKSQQTLEEEPSPIPAMEVHEDMPESRITWSVGAGMIAIITVVIFVFAGILFGIRSHLQAKEMFERSNPPKLEGKKGKWTALKFSGFKDPKQVRDAIIGNVILLTKLAKEKNPLSTELPVKISSEVIRTLSMIDDYDCKVPIDLFMYKENPLFALFLEREDDITSIPKTLKAGHTYYRYGPDGGLIKLLEGSSLKNLQICYTDLNELGRELSGLINREASTDKQQPKI